MIEIYTTERCPKCTIIKGLLKQKKVAYTERKLASHEDKDVFITKYNVRAVPFVVVDGEVIGDAKVAALWIQKTYGE